MNLSPALRFLASHQWAMESATFDQLVALLERHAAGERLDRDAVAAAIGRSPDAIDVGEPGMEITGDTAVIPMRGVLARYADGVNGACQARGRSAESVQRDLIAAAEAGVNRIILRMDSPGGEVSGTAETAALLRQLSARGIQTVAFIDGMAASAAYWIASQADEIVASAPTSIVGSIGISSTIVERDPSAKGDRVHVITSAPAKASPVMNEAQLSNARALVMDLAAAFADAVSAGRGLTAEATAKVATGEVWTAAQAQALGLVDRIAPFSDLLGASRIPAAGRTATATTVAQTINPAANTAAAEEEPMKLTAQALAALVAAFPIHSAFISERALAGDEEGAIRTAIAAKEAEISRKAISDAQASIAAEREAHAATKAELAATKAKYDQLAALVPKHQDPGPSADEGKALVKTQAEVDAMRPSDQAKFYAGGGTVG